MKTKQQQYRDLVKAKRDARSTFKRKLAKEQKKAEEAKKSKTEALQEVIDARNISTNTIGAKPVRSKEDKAMEEGLPEGFFDDEQRGEKVQNRLTGKTTVKKQEKEEEWKKYQQEMAIETTEMEKKQLKSEIEDQVMRELADAQFQIHLYHKSDKLADIFEAKAEELNRDHSNIFR